MESNIIKIKNHANTCALKRDVLCPRNALLEKSAAQLTQVKNGRDGGI